VSASPTLGIHRDVDVGGVLDLGGHRHGLLEELVILEHHVHNGLSVLDLVHDRRVVGDRLEGELLDGRLGLLEILGIAVREGVVTPHTDRFVARRLLPTVRTPNRRVIGRVLGLDVLPVELGVLLRAVLPVHRDVVRDCVAPALAALSILDERFVLPELREPGRVALPEVLRRHRLLETDPVGGALEVPHERCIGHPVAVVLHPEIGIVIARPRVVVAEVAIEIGDRQDQCDRTLASLPVDFDLGAVRRLLYIADAELVEFAVRPESALELDGEQRLIPGVRGATVDEREDVLLPVEHVGAGGLWVVVPGRVSRHPVDRFGRVFMGAETEGVLAERADGESVVALRPGVFVGAIDPADDVLGGVSLFERVGEAADLLGGADGVSEELLMPVIRVVVEIHLVGEEEQVVGVVVADGVASVLFAVVVVGGAAGSDAVAESLNLITLRHVVAATASGQDLTIGLESRPRLFCRATRRGGSSPRHHARL